MKCGDWPVSVCSWSLRTDVPGVAAAMRALALANVSVVTLLGGVMAINYAEKPLPRLPPCQG